MIKSHCKIHKEVVPLKCFAGVAVSILKQLIFLKFAQTLLFLWDKRPHEGLKSGTGATFSIANKWSNRQKTNRLKNVSIRVQYTKDTCFSYKNTIGATCRSIVDFFTQGRKISKIGCFRLWKWRLSIACT